MYGITTQDIVNANGVTIRKGEKVECLLISKIMRVYSYQNLV